MKVSEADLRKRLGARAFDAWCLLVDLADDEGQLTVNPGDLIEGSRSTRKRVLRALRAAGLLDHLGQVGKTVRTFAVFGTRLPGGFALIPDGPPSEPKPRGSTRGSKPKSGPPWTPSPRGSNTESLPNQVRSDRSQPAEAEGVQGGPAVSAAKGVHADEKTNDSVEPDPSKIPDFGLQRLPPLPPHASLPPTEGVKLPPYPPFGFESNDSFCSSLRSSQKRVHAASVGAVSAGASPTPPEAAGGSPAGAERLRRAESGVESNPLDTPQPTELDVRQMLAHPSVPRRPNVDTITAKIPPAPPLDPALPVEQQLEVLRTAYLDARDRLFPTAKPYWPFRRSGALAKSRYTKAFRSAAAALADKRLAPAAYADWYMSFWKRSHSEPPPPTRVWSGSKIMASRHIFRREAGAEVTRRLYGPAAKQLTARWYRMHQALLVSDGRPESVKAIAERFFPAGTYDDLLAAAEMEASASQANTNEDIDWGKLL